MNINDLLAMKDEVNARVDASSAELKKVCAPHKNETGLVSDEFRQSDEYKQARAQFDKDWNAMRSFNETHSKNKELSDAVHARWMARRNRA